jgi:hypothetical protein
MGYGRSGRGCHTRGGSTLQPKVGCARVLRELRFVVNAAPETLGLDRFRSRQQYGLILVDLAERRLIGGLSDGEVSTSAATPTAWSSAANIGQPRAWPAISDSDQGQDRAAVVLFGPSIPQGRTFASLSRPGSLARLHSKRGAIKVEETVRMRASAGAFHAAGAMDDHASRGQRIRRCGPTQTS